MASVKLIFGGQEVGTYKLDKPAMVVGRDERCEIHIDNLGVSRNHCQFIRRGDGFLIQDMNSSNGTYVNGKRISEQPLSNNDQILIGKYSMTFVDDGQDYGVSAPAEASAPAAAGGGGMEAMHTYVMDGAKIRERLMQDMQGGGEAGADALAPQQTRPAAPAAKAPSGGSKAVMILVIVLIVVLLVVLIGLGLVVWVVLQSSGAPAVEPTPTPGVLAPLRALLPY